jgi:hypothetical protein
MAERRKRTISPEERQRRSERAKQLVAEGKIGGARTSAGRKPSSERILRDMGLHPELAKQAAELADDPDLLKPPPAFAHGKRNRVRAEWKERMALYDSMTVADLYELLRANIDQLNAEHDDTGYDDHLRVPRVDEEATNPAKFEDHDDSDLQSSAASRPAKRQPEPVEPVQVDEDDEPTLDELSGVDLEAMFQTADQLAAAHEGIAVPPDPVVDLTEPHTRAFLTSRNEHEQRPPGRKYV